MVPYNTQEVNVHRAHIMYIMIEQFATEVMGELIVLQLFT